MTNRTPLRKAAAGIITALLAVAVLAADQFTKHLAIESLPPEVPVPILGDFLVFRLVRNPGAAFSLGESVTWIFTIALAAVAVGIVYLLCTRVQSRLWAVVLGGLLGGVLGNLGDRVFRAPGFPVGHVVDFISTPWMIPAIYNVADIFIVSSMIAVALLVLVGLHMDGTRESAKQASGEAALTDGHRSDGAAAAAIVTGAGLADTSTSTVVTSGDDADRATADHDQAPGVVEQDTSDTPDTGSSDAGTDGAGSSGSDSAGGD